MVKMMQIEYDEHKDGDDEHEHDEHDEHNEFFESELCGKDYDEQNVHFRFRCFSLAIFCDERLLESG